VGLNLGDMIKGFSLFYLKLQFKFLFSEARWNEYSFLNSFAIIDAGSKKVSLPISSKILSVFSGISGLGLALNTYST
jgi:hypothetical protein